jgi:hypothetical protein
VDTTEIAHTRVRACLHQNDECVDPLWINSMWLSSKPRRCISDGRHTCSTTRGGTDDKWSKELCATDTCSAKIQHATLVRPLLQGYKIIEVTTQLSWYD